MGLRARLVLTVMVAAIPLIAGLAWSWDLVERYLAEDQLRQWILNEMEYGGRERCEARPQNFAIVNHTRDPARSFMAAQNYDRLFDGQDRPVGGMRGRDPMFRNPPGPPQEFLGERRPHTLQVLHAYYPDFTSANRTAPEFPAELRSEIGTNDRSASSARPKGEGRELMMAMRMDWTEGPCVIILARRSLEAPKSVRRGFLAGAAGTILFLLGAVLFAAGPLVRRVRRLTLLVQRSASSHYTDDIEVAGKDELSELALAFNTASAELRDQVEATKERESSLRDFVANTTHDVMIPLTVLQGHLSRVRDRIAEGKAIDAATVHDALEESHYLASLMANLGAASKLEASDADIQRHPVDLCELIHRLHGRHGPIARQKGVALDLALPEEALQTIGDVTLLEQAVGNAVHNAIRYNLTGGRVLILLEELPSDRFALRVMDDGPGLPHEVLHRMTERAWRDEAARQRFPSGSGLGLNIAREVARRHGFRLEIRASEPGGLEVEFSGDILRG